MKFTQPHDHWVEAYDPKTLLIWRYKARLKIFVWKANIKLLETLKRLIDIVFSLGLLLAASPILLLVFALIKIEDNGPFLFSQPRVGKNGQMFMLYKIRSMVLDADSQKASLASSNLYTKGVIFKIKHDPRLTKVGKWIRKFSIDEFPQLINVLQGHMALVGPRPPLFDEVIKYKPIHLRRLIVKPGITCLWQIGGRNFLDFEDQVRLDLKYIHAKGILTDLKILLKTIPAVLFGRGAY